MGTYNRIFETTIQALEDQRTLQYHAIALDDGKLANNAEEATGIIYNNPNTNEFAQVVYFGEAKYRAGGGTHTAGQKLTVGTSGWLETANSWDTVVGEAKTTVTSGSIGTGFFNFAGIKDDPRFFTADATPACNFLAGIAYSLVDNLVANNGSETQGVAIAAMSSGTAGKIGISGIIPVKVADTTSAGNPLTVTTSGYWSIADSGDYVIAYALANVASGINGDASVSIPGWLWTV